MLSSLPSLFQKCMSRVSRALVEPALEPLLSRPPSPDTVTQLALVFHYEKLVKDGAALPAFSDVGFKCMSQTDDDGILLFLFSVLGFGTRRCVEICAGDGIECNTANFITHHGWHGLLVDGCERNVARGRKYFSTLANTYVFPPIFEHRWVTRESVNALCEAHQFTGDIDLLSLDLDGVDYWIWEALTACSPRVVVLEFNNVLGPERSWTVPYADDFNYRRYPTTNGAPNFAGASLKAFVELGHRKGYRLVGTNRLGFNAFFVRNGHGDDLLPEVPVADCFAHPKTHQDRCVRWPLIKDLPWIDLAQSRQ